MPWSKDASTQSLRLAYNAAVAGHANCSRALTEATMRGDAPSLALIEAEQKARSVLDSARAKLHAAMASAIGAAQERPHTCDREGLPARVVEELGDAAISGIYPTCSVCGVPDALEE
jgi:hypothetical protein